MEGGGIAVGYDEVDDISFDRPASTGSKASVVRAVIGFVLR